MNPWLVSISALVIFALGVGALTNVIVRRTGCSSKPHWLLRVSAAVGTGVVVGVTQALFNVSAPYLVLVAGVAAGTLFFVAQAVWSWRAI
jgi:hypothetical protein